MTRLSRLSASMARRIGSACGQSRDFMTRFARAEDGVMLALVLFLILIMLTVGGVGVDLMRAEMERTRIQQTMDSAALAAAHKDNALEPKSVVLDYFAKANLASYIGEENIQVEGLAGNRAVEVRLEAGVKTQFLGSLGFDEFRVPAATRAEEAIGDAEVSLVVDISGSMNSNSRMTRLHSAAKEFIDTVLKPEYVNKISVSLVPYTADVNAGFEIFSRLNARQLHNYSYCLQFLPTDFSKTDIDPEQAFIQGQYFARSGDFSSISCPTQSYEEITAFSQNATSLKTQIGNLTGREQTSIHIGMKWATGLLDPKFRPVVSSMIDAGLIDEAFEGRPTDFGTNSLKTIVLMTDGANTESHRLQDFAYDTPDMRAHWGRNVLLGNNGYANSIDSSVRNDIYQTAYTTTTGNSYLSSICTKAKQAGIIVWTIGFEVDNTSASILQSCASSANHFYRVEGVQISEAFASIARQLKQLRLTL